MGALKPRVHEHSGLGAHSLLSLLPFQPREVEDANISFGPSWLPSSLSTAPEPVRLKAIMMSPWLSRPSAKRESVNLRVPHQIVAPEDHISMSDDDSGSHRHYYDPGNGASFDGPLSPGTGGAWDSDFHHTGRRNGERSSGPLSPSSTDSRSSPP